jgi:hypothetical protein
LNGGKAMLTTSSLSAGNHTITSTYSGDIKFSPSSVSLIQTVNRAPPRFAQRRPASLPSGSRLA